MAQASRNVKKLRRMKRERSLALRMAEFALNQRDEARQVANMLARKLEEKEQPIVMEAPQNEQELSGGPQG